MATVSAVVYEGQKKADGTYNVKIRVFDRTLSKSFVIPVSWVFKTSGRS
ncbi:hypothetical protein M2273_001005 [Mucilaginibacter lappiensis]|jgi:hypothetical protein